MRILMLVAILFTTLSSTAQSSAEIKIRQVMAKQEADWNRGDIPAYMEGYWKNDSLMFIGKSGVTYGWQNTLKNYLKGYPDSAHMGKLNFNLIKVERLSKNYYSVVGKWFLKRSAGDVGGHFTLLFRKFKNNWLIISDHSS